MALLIFFGLLAGAATALSPCVLPVLPVALAAGVTGGRRRPLGVVTGLVVTFTFATVLLVYVIDALGLPDDLVRNLAIAVLVGFGITLIVPGLAARVEAWFSRFAPDAPVVQGDGFWSGVLLGSGLGFVYAPCAGPILAGVITVSASQGFAAGRLAVALAYGLGTAIVLYALMIGGRKLTSKLVRNSAHFQIATGVVMVVLGVAMFAQLDIRFQNAIADDLPSALVNPSEGLEKSDAIADDLDGLRRTQTKFKEPAAAANGRASDLPVIGNAPDFADTGTWFNTPGGRKLTLKELRGRVVLIDFWTYSCINCLRTLPYIKAWDEKYRPKGLTIVGVHAPEFPFERNTGNVRSAVKRNGIKYPVAQDNNYGTWDAYGNQYWPAKYLIDAKGKVRTLHIGEGGYDETEADIRSLLEEAYPGRLGPKTRTKAEGPSGGELTPESYLGSSRAHNFSNRLVTGDHDYGESSGNPDSNMLQYSGNWNVGPEYATAGSRAALKLRFNARRVFLVLGSPDRKRGVRVLLDGKPVSPAVAGDDVKNGSATIGFERLYKLIDLPQVSEHTLTLIPEAGTKGYAFTFG